MEKKKTLVIGASDNPSRYSFLAVQKLRRFEHPVVAIGRKHTKVVDVAVEKEKLAFDGVNTVTLYLNPSHQKEYYDYILSLKPQRIIFNPGTENEELESLAKDNAASHEAGHTLGLYHQASYDANCTKLTDYNAGTGAGEIGWAPIMGVGYYRNMTLWNNGPNSYGCSNFQSDLDIITSVTNGFGYRNDDHSNDFSNATVAAITNNTFTSSGIIEKNTDIDLFKFTMPAFGRFELNAIPYNVGTGNTGSDLDLQVSLINGSQNVLNVYNPGTLLSSVVDTSLNPGVYYIRVEGKGNLYAPNYASLGSYSLQGTTTPGSVLPIRKLELRGAMEGDRHSLSWTIEADEQLVSQPLVQSPAADRMYAYRPSTPLSAQYRLHVTFDNGHEYYSNIITIRNDPNAPRPKLVSTLIHSSEVTITSPGNYEYIIVDMNGKTVSKGKLVNGLNTVQAPGITTGLYLLRTSNLEQSWTDKFIRQ
ncbi:bacterial pre-peptidase domain protein [Ostertagia ostertagi]